MGANVQDSMVYDWLTRFHKIDPMEFSPIAGRLTTELKPRNCVIRYFFEERYFSKNLYQSLDGEGATWIDRMDNEVVQLFGNQPYLYVANNGRKSAIVAKSPNVKKIPVICHGLNQYRNYTNIYFSAALNRTPKHLKILRGWVFPMSQFVMLVHMRQSINPSCEQP